MPRKQKAKKIEPRGRKSRPRRDTSDEREPSTGQHKRVIHAAPIYDLVGWATEADAAVIKSAQAGKKVSRSTISRWRSGGFVHAVDLNNALVIVDEQQILDFEGIPLGNPRVIKAGMPERQDPLPRTIRLTLKRRR